MGIVGNSGGQAHVLRLPLHDGLVGEGVVGLGQDASRHLLLVCGCKLLALNNKIKILKYGQQELM